MAQQHTRIAKTFLGWFAQGASGEVLYAPETDYVERYRKDGEGWKNAMDSVRSLAYSRLPIDEAKEVITEAQKLLRPHG